MKNIFLPVFLLFFSAGIIIISCKKNTDFHPTTSGSNPTNIAHASPTTFASCQNRPVVKVDLVPVGSLSITRSSMSAATAGSKILFAGGGFSGVGYSS